MTVQDIERSEHTSTAHDRALLHVLIDIDQQREVSRTLHPPILSFLGNSSCFSGGGDRLVFNHDATRMANTSGGLDLLDPATGAVIASIQHDFGVMQDYLTMGAFFDEGRKLVGVTAKELVTFDVDQRSLIERRPHDKRCFVLAVAVSDRHGVVAFADNSAVVMHALPSLERLHAPKGHANSVNLVGISPDARRVASCDGGELKLWDCSPPSSPATSGDLAEELGARLLWTRPSNGWTSLAFSPVEGDLRLLCDIDSRPHLLDATTGEIIHAAAEHTGGVSAFRSTDALLVHVGYREGHAPGDPPAFVWFAEGPDAHVLLERESKHLRCVPKLSADGTTALFYDEFTLYCWSVPRGELRWSRDLEVVGVAIADDARSIAVTVIAGRDQIVLLDGDGSADGSARVVRVDGLGLTYALAFSPDCTKLAAGLEDGRVVLFDLTTADAPPPMILGRHDGQVSVVRFSASGTTLVSGGADATVCVWAIREDPS